MMHEWDDHNGLLRRYLLGSTSEGEREQLEQALLADDNLYEELLATEDELIDQYVWDRLAESERAGFLQYLSDLPDYRQKLEFAEALRSHNLAASTDAPAAREMADPEYRGRSHLQVPAWIWAAAILLIMLGGAWSLVMLSGLREEVGRTQAELARFQERQDELQRQQASVQESRVSRPGDGSFLLRAGTFRSGGSRQVVPIPREPQLVEFQLDLGSADYGTYRAVVHDANALELMSRSQLRARTQEDRILVVFRASSDLFTPGDYYVSLMGDVEAGEPEPVARYDFRVSSE